MSKENSNSDKKIRLDDIKTKSQYKAPDGYFENLTASIDKLIDEEESKVEESKFAKVVSLRKGWYYIAASLAAACVVIAFWVFPLNTDNNPELLLSEVSNDEIIAYLAYSELNTEDIVNELVSNDISVEEPMPEFELSNEDADALLDYYAL
jgi:hypothetical protein